MTSIRRTSALAAALTVAFGLSGCAVTGTNFQPGQAASVSDRVVTTDEVDTLTTDFCDALESADQLQGQQIPLGLLRSQMAEVLLQRAGADELAERNGVEAGAEYEDSISQLEAAIVDLSESQQKAVLAYQGGGAYVSSVLSRVGEQMLSAEGGPVDNPDAAFARGQQALNELLLASGEINPVYGITITDSGELDTTVPTSVSEGIGDNARAAGLDLFDDTGVPAPEAAAYVASLPESQRCG